jgi:hypothetical protein
MNTGDGATNWKQRSPYSTLIDSLPQHSLPSGSSFHSDEDASTRWLAPCSLYISPSSPHPLSSSSSDELSLHSNHKRSDLSHFRKKSLVPTNAPSHRPDQEQYDSILRISIQKPEVLIGWKIEVPQYGRGVILDFHKKRFRSTKYRVLFDNQKERLLKLKRSEKKGKIPFTFLEPIEGELFEK